MDDYRSRPFDTRATTKTIEQVNYSTSLLIATIEDKLDVAEFLIAVTLVSVFFYALAVICLIFLVCQYVSGWGVL